MNGYAVVTSDDKRFGSVVDDRGEYLVVELGTIRKARHALPKAFAHPVDAERLVRVTVSKQLLSESPRVKGGGVDERAVARHYGLAAGWAQPDTEGAGDILPDDPAESAVVEGERHGVASPERTRAEIREGEHDLDVPAVHGRTPNAIDPGGSL